MLYRRRSYAGITWVRQQNRTVAYIAGRRPLLTINQYSLKARRARRVPIRLSLVRCAELPLRRLRIDRRAAARAVRRLRRSYERSADRGPLHATHRSGNDGAVAGLTHAPSALERCN